MNRAPFAGFYNFGAVMLLAATQREEIKMVEDSAEFNWQNAERPMAEVTVRQLDNLVSECFQLQDEVDAVETQLKDKARHLANAKARLLAIFQEHDKRNYRTHRGQLIREKRFTVLMPKEPEKRKEFFDYLRKKQLLDQMMTVNSQTLNAFYKGEMEAAITAGQTKFEMPGVAEPKLVESIKIRRTRG